MNIIYRISPFKPDNPSVFYPEDKYKMVQLCHDSFLKAGGANYPITYVIDSCDWGKDFEKYGKIINFEAHSKVKSLLMAFEIGLNTKDDVLFLEDDYLWRPNTLPLLEIATKELKVVSPYDHPAHYIEERFDKRYELRLLGNTVYRTCPSNTHTFAIDKDTLAQNYDLIASHGVQDHQMFTELKKKAQLWCPTYSFATHLANGCLAPNIRWIDFT